jgi:glucose-6-phosphate 1-epimerase
VRNANAGGEAFDFTAALHSYFEVVDAALPAVRVTGLKGKAYLDKVPDPKAPSRRVEDADAVRASRARCAYARARCCSACSRQARARRACTSRQVTFGKALVDRVYLDTDAETLLEVGTGAAVISGARQGLANSASSGTCTPRCRAAWPALRAASVAVTRPVSTAAGYVWEAETKTPVIDCLAAMSIPGRLRSRRLSAAGVNRTERSTSSSSKSSYCKRAARCGALRA